MIWNVDVWRLLEQGLNHALIAFTPPTYAFHLSGAILYVASHQEAYHEFPHIENRYL